MNAITINVIEEKRNVNLQSKASRKRGFAAMRQVYQNAQCAHQTRQTARWGFARDVPSDESAKPTLFPLVYSGLFLSSWFLH